MTSIRGIRGAITTEENTKESIRSNARQLLEEVLEDPKTQKIKCENIKNPILSRNISNLIKSDIEIWIKININIMIAQNVREVFNSIVIKHNKE